MKCFEYTYAHCDPTDDPVREINQMGKEGWEVCAYEQPNKDHDGVFYLKRELIDIETVLKSL